MKCKNKAKLCYCTIAWVLNCNWSLILNEVAAGGVQIVEEVESN